MLSSCPQLAGEAMGYSGTHFLSTYLWAQLSTDTQVNRGSYSLAVANCQGFPLSGSFAFTSLKVHDLSFTVL